ncbi:MAG: GntR family transcriptional regulator, partial [Rhodobacteraceae bacterium]|nr:GntR family transcriptional regulator [Paracoccaceae bacterium]
MPEAGEDAGGARMHEAYEKIRGAILAGMYRPGVRLSQVKISEELGLSRTPVREALRMIEKEGLLTS